jgi:hypothetical protein
LNHDNLHRIATEHYIREVEKAFQRLISQTASAVVKTKLKKELFQFKKNSKITERIAQILSEYENSLLGIISTGSARQWNFANEKYNYLKALTLKRIANKIPKEVFQKELLKVAANTQNARALLSFQQRKTNGFTLSDRVWNITKQAKEELELAIDLSLTEGQSANTLARAIRKHLNNPNSLYKKIKDKHGNAVLLNNTDYYHVGQGVYRSAYKNAMRLARNEINTAYRTSEQLRIEQNNDIVGVEIHLSPSHRIYDMCDELKGVYPKDFKWDKWHVNCMCHRRTIMKTDAEFIRELKNGENLPPETSENFVADVPKQYKDWIKENEDKMQNWKRKPEFMEWNEKYWKGDTKREREKNILLLDREKQFDTLHEYGNGGKVLQHKLIKRGEDYEDIMRAAKLFAEQGKIVELMPEVYKNERTIRNVIFPNLQSKTSNPDLRIGNKYYDVKRPSSIKNIEGNANKASKQGSVAIISDSRLDKELTERIMKIRANAILKSKNYTKTVIVYLKNDKLYFY